MSQFRTGRIVRVVGIVFMLSVFLTGCSTVGYYMNLWQASRAGARYYRNYEPGVRDLAYTEISEVELDVYSPETGTGHPVLVFIHGGGWNKYDKELFAPVAMQLVPRDMVVVIPDYTLHPDAGYEQMARETAAAVAWTFENISDYGGDPEQVVLSGHSAGGHLSGLVALDGRWLGEEGYAPTELCGWVGLSGVYSADRQLAYEQESGGEAPVMTEVMGGRDHFPAASPESYVEEFAAGAEAVEAAGAGAGAARLPRITLIHGARDETVPVSMSEALAGAFAAEGVPVELKIYPESGHSDFLFDGLADENAPVLLDLSEAVGICGDR